jgi:hypothetical protein
VNRAVGQLIKSASWLAECKNRFAHHRSRRGLICRTGFLDNRKSRRLAPTSTLHAALRQTKAYNFLLSMGLGVQIQEEHQHLVKFGPRLADLQCTHTVPIQAPVWKTPSHGTKRRFVGGFGWKWRRRKRLRSSSETSEAPDQGSNRASRCELTSLDTVSMFWRTLAVQLDDAIFALGVLATRCTEKNTARRV